MTIGFWTRKQGWVVCNPLVFLYFLVAVSMTASTWRILKTEKRGETDGVVLAKLATISNASVIV